MSDSESSETNLSNNIFTFQGTGSSIWAKGPYVNSTNISSLSFRNSTVSSNMPCNSGRPRYAESVCDPRSISFRRERVVSPCRSMSGLQNNCPGGSVTTTNVNSMNISGLSLSTMSSNMCWNPGRPRYAESVCDPRSMSFRRKRVVSPCRSMSGLHHNYPGGWGSQRSLVNGRSVSPVSVRSYRTNDSNFSRKSRDIASAIRNGYRNGEFNEHDIRILYKSFQVIKNMEKKKKRRMYLKGFRQRVEGDSGDQASNSSISSDDDRYSLQSSRSTLHKNGITPNDILQFRRTMRENEMVKDQTENFRQMSYKNMYPVRPPSVESTQPIAQNNSVHKNTYKGTFPPSYQRFNPSLASSITDRISRLSSINEDNMREPTSSVHEQNNGQKDTMIDVSDSEQIFSEVTYTERNNNGKRILEGGVPASQGKRTKLVSPQKNNTKPKSPKQNKLNSSATRKSGNFVFAKPRLPIKKLGIVKKSTQQNVTKPTEPQNQATANKKAARNFQETVDSSRKTSTQSEEKLESDVMSHSKEKLICSSQTAQEKSMAASRQVLETNQSTSRLTAVEEQEKGLCPKAESTQLSLTNMSMRPSFIKRKLFTQKVDETAKNTSSDSLAESPQSNIYSKIQKDKHKARKLATQSCLSRDVEDDSNLLDLIHKVVPPDRINVTSINRSELPNNKSKPNNDNETTTWNVTAMISTCNHEDVSDTYTDEEIFGENDKENQIQNKAPILKRDDQNKTKDEVTQKDKIEKQKEAAGKYNTISVTAKHNEHLEKKQSKSTESKQSKKDKKQMLNKPPKQNVNAAEKCDNEEVKLGRTASENEDLVTVEEGKSSAQQQNKTTHINRKTSNKKQNASVALKENTVTAGKQNKPGIEKATYFAVGKTLVTSDKQSSNNGLSPPDKDVRIQANIYKDIKSFWDADTDSEFEALPLYRITQMGQLNSRPLSGLARGVIVSDTEPASQLITSPDKSMKENSSHKLQGKDNDKKQCPRATQKEIKNTEHIIKQSLNKKENAVSDKGSSNDLSNSSERKSPVKNIKHVNNKTNKTSSLTKQNLPPTENTGNKRTTTSSKLDITQKTNNKSIDDRSKSPVKNIKHVNNRTNKTSSLTKENRLPTENIGNNKTTSNSKLDTTQRTHNESIDDRETESTYSNVRKLKTRSKEHNITLNRPQIKRKRNCCDELDVTTSSALSVDDTSQEHRRSGRIHLSTLKSDDNEISLNKKSALTNKKIDKITSRNKRDNDYVLVDDLDSAVANRKIRNRRPTAKNQTPTSISDISFTLGSDKKDSVSRKTSRKSREVEWLLESSASFLKTPFRSPLCNRRRGGDRLRSLSRSRRIF